ncbi:MAG TPA: hypothetical protein VIH57_09880 [Bacteroidales bacterium]
MIHCRLYKNGWLELPDGKIVAGEWLIDRIYQNINRPMTKEQIRELLRLIYDCGLEMGRYLVIGDSEERKAKIEFMSEDLESSRNPALNN